MTETVDPTFYRTPGDAIAAAPESLAYVAAFDPKGAAKDAIAVLDCDATSTTYGKVVGWAELPTGGNELHHFGWNACSSALCHGGHAGHLEPRPASRSAAGLRWWRSAATANAST
jgi:selenium-binding protein 1